MKIFRLDKRLELSKLVLVLITICGFFITAEAGGTPTNVIRIWSVGSPFSGALPRTTIPPDLQAQARALGYELVVENLLAAGFPERLHQAVANHTEPEVITYDNLGILIGVNTPTGRYQGVLNTDYEIAASLELVNERFASLQPRGWSVLVQTAGNYQAARAMVMQPPQCQGGPKVSEEAGSGELKQAFEAASNATLAYLACDVAALAALSDDEKLGRKCFLPPATVQVTRLDPCNAIGNDRLVFVSLASTFVSQPRASAPRRDYGYASWLTLNSLGQQTILAVLRKQGAAWRLFAISDDPVVTNESISAAHSGAPSYAKVSRLNGLLRNDLPETIPTPALLRTTDGAILRRLSQQSFEDFEWTPSVSPDVVAEVAEFLVGNDNEIRQRTRLLFFTGHEERLSSGALWGVLGRWRVWSISKSGNIALTDTRSYLQR
jgi:hypothetical protein